MAASNKNTLLNPIANIAHSQERQEGSDFTAFTCRYVPAGVAAWLFLNPVVTPGITVQRRESLPSD